MAKIRVFGPKNRLMEVVGTIHELGVVHIEDFSHDMEDENIVSRMGYSIVSRMHYSKVFDKERRVLQDEFLKAKAVLDQLPTVPKDAIKYAELLRRYGEMEEKELIGLAGSRVQAVKAKIEPLIRRRKYIQNRLASFPKYKNILQKIQPLVSRLTTFRSLRTIALIIQREFEGVLDILKNEIARITDNQYEILSAEVDEETIAAILLVREKHFDEVNALINEQNVNELKLPEHLADIPLDEVFETLDREERELPLEFAEMQKVLTGIARDEETELKAIVDSLGDRKSEIDKLPQFAETETCFLIVGWVPQVELKGLEETLRERYGGDVVVHSSKPLREEYEHVPVKLKNVPGAHMYEWLLGLVDYPRYGTIDPTLLMALFFPVFFGMILGDVGYGLLLFIFAATVKMRMKDRPFIQKFSPILMVSAVSSMIFGFLYGEFFGELPPPFRLHPLWFNRMEEISTFLVYAIALGAAHIFLGLILGVINGIKTRHFAHAVERGTTIIALIAMGIALAGAVGAVPKSLVTPAVIVIVASIPVLIYTAGILGAIELMSTVGNILSYARIAAIGISSVILALVANKLAGVSGSIIVGVVIAVLIHTMNLVLGAFSPSIHSIRLHYVEFFTKFYEGGHNLYRPFIRMGR